MDQDTGFGDVEASDNGYFQCGYFGYGSGYSPTDIRAELDPLIKCLQFYDTRRVSLERFGGRMEDLKILTRILTDPVTLPHGSGATQAPLTDQDRIKQALFHIHPNLHMSVRQLPFGMPVYYLYRKMRCWDANYHFVIEEFYTSPGYPRQNTKFIKLMHGGHETFYLNMAPFRTPYAEMTRQKDPEDRRQIDDFLCDGVGRHVFQSAWHEDQQLGNAISKVLDLPEFQYAIELLYLCLSADPCELRSAVTEEMKLFFRNIYPQPAICRLLEILPGFDGALLNNLSNMALDLYKYLSKEFGRFLASEILWGHLGEPTPLWKIIYANSSRLETIGRALRAAPRIDKAKQRLMKVSQSVISALLDTGNKAFA